MIVTENKTEITNELRWGKVTLRNSMRECWGVLKLFNILFISVYIILSTLVTFQRPIRSQLYVN